MNRITEYRNRLKGYPYLYHLVLIVGTIVALLLAAHYAMRIGTRHGQHRTVPDFTGLALDDAGRLARRCNLELRVNDSLYVPAYDGGVVLDQLPHEGTQVKGGRTVYVTINSFAQKRVDVPYVAGRSLRQAKNMLEIAGLEIDRLVYRPDMATNYVLEQRVEGRPVDASTKRQLEMGSGVTLYVGVAEGEGAVVVPKVVGVSLREAKSRLWEQGLNVGAVVFDEGIDLLNQKDARVYRQQPAQGPCRRCWARPWSCAWDSMRRRSRAKAPLRTSRRARSSRSANGGWRPSRTRWPRPRCAVMPRSCSRAERRLPKRITSFRR